MQKKCPVYANEWGKVVEVDIQIPMELVMYESNPYEFASVILMIQRASVGKFLKDWNHTKIL